MAAKTDLGKRFVCFKCECRFYDMGAPVPLCPRCGADQRENPNPDPRAVLRAGGKTKRKRKPKAKPAPKAVKPTPTPPEPDLNKVGDDSLLDDEPAADAKKKK
jgi:hypothetical protein